MEKCGCVGLRVNNDSVIKYCPLHASAPTLLAALTEGLGIYPGYTFADDLEAIAEILDDYHLAIASNLEAKAQAIRAAIAQARGE